MPKLAFTVILDGIYRESDIIILKIYMLAHIN